MCKKVFVVRKRPSGKRTVWTRSYALLLISLSCFLLVNLKLKCLVETDLQSRASPSATPYFHPATILKSSESTHPQSSPRRVLVIAAAPRSLKHIVSLWGSLECFANEAEHVAIAGPIWSQPLLKRFMDEVLNKIPRFSTKTASIEAMVTVNDRYDVGLWCDALGKLNKNSVPYDEFSLLNDSIFALRQSDEIFTALGEKNVSMTSLNYSLIHPKGRGDEYYWLESVWRGFDQDGIAKFQQHSCLHSTDPLFCNKAWWGQKGCIVEYFERQMAWQFPRHKTYGLYPSDVPQDMLTRRDSFPSWVRHAPYWKHLVEEQNFPVSKVNWESMIADINDERLQTCTQHLDRSWLEGFEFSGAKSTI